MSDNTTLHKAKKAKKDEFYTQLVDINNELRHYKTHFKDKVVYCNCDDPYESNFFKFFAANFNAWGLKKLITTCYDGSPVSGEQLSLDHIEGLSPEDGRDGGAYKIEITSVTDLDGDGAVGLSDVELLLKQNGNVVSPLEGNGDFRSDECIALLEESDIVVTNPPFSLFRKYVAQIMNHDKQFLVIGHQNAIKYKEIWPYIKEGRMWLGYGFKGGAAHFVSPYEDRAVATDRREGMIRVSGVVWFTNMDHSKRHEELPLFREYNGADYPRYDNYDAINVKWTADIPCDYEGAMGVPITFLNKHNPDQFEIVGLDRPLMTALTGKVTCFWLEGKELYSRIVIRRIGQQ
ncbi:MAG: adenine-specific methyltransferase EcoRI family protein [Acidimicrobiia bacterium]|nr:adenine-specific methyltransferase EcoRI family protein [Acidimicrobiia bacterium]MCY4457594.1 adenine-specific methyltransferase EcoRI family protein [Acidimicrobiaceae bacterium]